MDWASRNDDAIYPILYVYSIAAINAISPYILLCIIFEWKHSSRVRARHPLLLATTPTLPMRKSVSMLSAANCENLPRKISRAHWLLRILNAQSKMPARLRENLPIIQLLLTQNSYSSPYSSSYSNSRLHLDSPRLFPANPISYRLAIPPISSNSPTYRAIIFGPACQQMLQCRQWTAKWQTRAPISIFQDGLPSPLPHKLGCRPMRENFQFSLNSNRHYLESQWTCNQIKIKTDPAVLLPKGLSSTIIPAKRTFLSLSLSHSQLLLLLIPNHSQ